jgi:hypothetical protein
MLRLAEFGLFLLPFALYLAWVFASKRARPVVFWGVAAVLVPLAGGLLWFGLADSLDANERYVPAHVEAGRIVPGHGAAVDPATRVAPGLNAPWPVAPHAVSP